MVGSPAMNIEQHLFWKRVVAFWDVPDPDKPTAILNALDAGMCPFEAEHLAASHLSTRPLLPYLAALIEQQSDAATV